MASAMFEEETSKLLRVPLRNIGASALMNAVKITYKGNWLLYVKGKGLKKKWHAKFVVIAQGCIYLYKNCMSSDHSHAFALQDFSRVEMPLKFNKRCCIALISVEKIGKSEIFDCLTEKERMECDALISSIFQQIRELGSGDSGVDVQDEREEDGNPENPYHYVSNIGPTMNTPESGNTESKASNQKINMTNSGTISQNMQSTKNRKVVNSNTERTVEERTLVSIANDQSKMSYRRNEIVNTPAFSATNNSPSEENVYENVTVRTLDHIHCSNGDKNIAKTVMTPEVASNQTTIRKQVMTPDAASNQTTARKQVMNTEAASNQTTFREQVMKTDAARVQTRENNVTTPSAATGQTRIRKHEKESSSDGSSEGSSFEEVEAVYQNMLFQENIHSFYMEGNHSAKDAIRTLENEAIGTFLVRKGNSSPYVLLVRMSNGKTEVIQYRIHELKGNFTLDKVVHFPSLGHLVQFYRSNSLPGYELSLKRGFREKEQTNN